MKARVQQLKAENSNFQFELQRLNVQMLQLLQATAIDGASGGARASQAEPDEDKKRVKILEDRIASQWTDDGVSQAII